MADEIRDVGGPTLYGFDWGPMEVTRMIVTTKGDRLLGVKSGSHSLQIAVSPKGRSVRVWLDGKRLVPEVPT